jgi:hypothetical protein
MAAATAVERLEVVVVGRGVVDPPTVSDHCADGSVPLHLGKRITRYGGQLHLVAIDLHQPRVADPEVVRDLVEDDAPHRGPQTLGIAARDPLERQAVDGDLVR